MQHSLRLIPDALRTHKMLAPVPLTPDHAQIDAFIPEDFWRVEMKRQVP
eukprot:CAMPEP_0118879672 /NCGR_PEP_ID=MMETSP1163-20130328/19418_1 /TAXON_ID=124430 /ORGANISM="Phaeomonas parva, Strain CCMP2877" /LENGTH=48 /DNA_ID= /DNA_START= /DNA_END= /DNA_ORIENTATION=